MFQLAAIAALMLQSASLDSATAAAIFGQRETVQQASLSPDGRNIAYLKPLPGQGGAVFVAPVDGVTEARPALMVDGKPERLESCRWTGNNRLLCLVYTITTLDGGELAYSTRWVGVDPDGGNMEILFNRNDQFKVRANLFAGRVVDWLPDEDGYVLMMREYIPEYRNAMNVQSRDGMAVDRVNTRTGHVAIVERAREQVIDYIGDGRGNVRIMGQRLASPSGYDKGVFEWFYRRKGSERWEKLGVTDDDDNGFIPAAVDADRDVAFGLKKLDGRLAAFTLALDGSMKETLVFTHPEVDVDGFLSIGRRGRIVGVSFATDRREAHYFDPELARLRKSLERALPKLPLIRFVDASLDENKLLIRAESDTDPGRYLLFDRSRKHLDDMMDVRPDLSGIQLASVRHLRYRAADGTMIPAYLTMPPGKEAAKGLPGIVMPHGGPGARDEWGFDWLAQFFANRGYAVLQPNFRGSDGYGDDWFLENGFQNWRVAIGDVDDGGRWLIAEGVADPKKLAIVGWSYGGYAALQSAVTEPGLFGAVVAIAPVTDLEMLKNEWRDWSNYLTTSKFIGSGPHLREGSPARNAAKIKVPVLLIHGTQDRNVSVKQSRVMAERLKAAGAHSELIVYDQLDHQLDDSRIRAGMLSRSDAFLRKSLGFSDRRRRLQTTGA